MLSKNAKRVFLIKKIDELQQAKEYAFLLLKYRPRSEYEFYQRLKKKKIKKDIIRETVAFLKDKGFIDDVYFAKTWVESRIKKPLGLKRIYSELQTRGVEERIIDACLSEIKNDYSEEDVVPEIITRQLKRFKNIDPEKAKRRIYSYLIQRGFSAETVMQVLSR